MADQMPRAEIGTQSALFADGTGHGKHRALVLHPPLDKRMAFRQHQQAAGGFGHRAIERGNQAAHHRAAVNKTGVVDRRAARQRQHFAQRHADGDGDGQRPGDRAVNGQRAAGHRKLLLNRAGQVEDRLHVIHHDPDAGRQRGGRDPATGSQPDSQHLIACGIDIGQNMQANTGRQQRGERIDSPAVFLFQGNHPFARAGCRHVGGKTRAPRADHARCAHALADLLCTPGHFSSVDGGTHSSSSSSS